jgi:hypothetical protein
MSEVLIEHWLRRLSPHLVFGHGSCGGAPVYTTKREGDITYISWEGEALAVDVGAAEPAHGCAEDAVSLLEPETGLVFLVLLGREMGEEVGCEKDDLPPSGIYVPFSIHCGSL